jgi:type I restriction enzyme R subunit
MNEFDYKERRFEEDIEASLITDGGYVKGNPNNFNCEIALDEGTFVEFIKRSQPKLWERYVKIYGVAPEKQIIARFVREVKQTNLLNVLRHGFTDRGIKFKAVFWKPASSLNETTQKQYEANILHCTRQLHYSLKNENSIDIVLFLNGIPVVSMELKCQFTGQNTTNAINQYKFDRAGKDAIFAFKERVLVHFAVDLTNVYMTTRLTGASTYFLPFNQGSNGAGNVGGKGNPNNENGYDTSYLWEKVLCKDRLLEILQKYMHLQQDIDKKTQEVKSETMIFPRYHQLDVVTKLLADVKENGSGKNYLIQHSAGSGKSNSIAWLAHRLSGLHDSLDEKIFQSVIIVTDRRVLDSQLQSTVYQFDHVEGVVQKIDKNSEQLKNAINGGAGIIITTLQKFPVIYKEVRAQNKRFAIIVDEAHSSQTGEAAKKLKRALADTAEILKEYAEVENEAELSRKDSEDSLLEELAAQGFHSNLSFFAFTATPKGKTLQMFGTQATDGTYHPFHVYSMRQAIEEGFILDVLKNYMTYKMYYKILKTIVDNPEFDTTAGAKAIVNYETLHPHNISQKTSIMLEHFMDITRHKMNGRAKAMVVTPSRLHAVKYVQEFKRQIEEKKYQNLDVLVAFSGEVSDGDQTYTEEGMNKNKAGEKIKEKSLPEAFHTDEFGILIVAEKYQTGFDEPLLHTMFVDKKLSGIKAVQTLSRLNRTARGKVDTFVLDFVNSAESIKKSFEPYFEETILTEETDPNVIYDMKNTLNDFRVYQTSEIENFAQIFFSGEKQTKDELGRLEGTLKPALDRFSTLETEKQELFKSTLAAFIRVYSFVTQVCRLFDKDIHKFSVYAKFLYKLLPKDGREVVDVNGKISLEYYKLEKDFDGSIDLEASKDGFKPISGEAGRREKKRDPLAVIIDKINEKYGTTFTEMDKVLLQLENDFASQDKWQSYAKNNDYSTFKLLFAKEFASVAADRFEQNDEFFKRMFEDSEMMNQVMDTVGLVLYEKLKQSAVHSS